MTPDASTVATAKGEATRQRIVAAALKLFQQNGYAKTTMRAVAAQAGVSLGNAYYYFGSKDELVQGFYDDLQDQHIARSQPIVASTSDLTERLLGIELAWLEIARPYRDFGGTFFATAADPKNPSSPFSPQSPDQRRTRALIARVVPLGVRVLKLTRRRPARPLVRQFLSLLDDVRA